MRKVKRMWKCQPLSTTSRPNDQRPLESIQSADQMREVGAVDLEKRDLGRDGAACAQAGERVSFPVAPRCGVCACAWPCAESAPQALRQ